jgi:hypothetical protein
MTLGTLDRNSFREGNGSNPATPVFAVLTALLALGALTASLPPIARAADPLPPRVNDQYILLGWNDLGMHCSNKRFADLAVLPPFNTAWSTLIRKGSATTLPQVVGPGFTVQYDIQGNTYSVGKTDFWTWAPQLFNVTLPDNIGLTGKGLTGTMDWNTDHFDAVGIPITPYDDADLVHEQPFQLANLRAYDSNNVLVASTQIVTPVSNEMTCNACHYPQSGETVDHAILRIHDQEEGTNLQNSRPVLCANCHASAALGMTGNPDLPSLSQAMHSKHAEETNDCYKCHPGPNTRCLRDVMSTQYGLTCQNCHGNTQQVATSIEQGRRPWLDEPRCQTCHGANYAESPGTLYRNSHNGHGGLFCETCHSSPHAILPSREERDDRQNVALQGHAGTLRECVVCHGVTPSGPGPHGYVPSSAPESGATARAAQVETAPNPMRESTEIRYRVVDSRPIRLAIVDATGREVRVLTANAQTPGDHTLVWDGRHADGSPAASGVYFAKLNTAGQTASARLVKIGR